MRFKKTLQYPGARRTGAGHHHGSDTPTSARAILHHTDQKEPNIMCNYIRFNTFLEINLFSQKIFSGKSV